MSPAGRPPKKPGASRPGDIPVPPPLPYRSPFEDAVSDIDESELEAPRAERVERIADRAERSRELSKLLRDPGATGAERVAAARMLEAMDRAERGESSALEIGPPPPTLREEQISRIVRVLASAGPEIRAEALAIVSERSRKGLERVRDLIAPLGRGIEFPTKVAEQPPAPPQESK